MGNIYEGVKNNELREEFKKCNVYSKISAKTASQDSIAAVDAANSYNAHGNINDAYDLGCELQKKRIECAIMIKAAEAELDAEE